MSRKPGTSMTLKAIYFFYIIAFLLFLFVPLVINGIIDFQQQRNSIFSVAGGNL